MKKPAKDASMTPVTPSMKKIAMFVPCASGESLWPKHTEHASNIVELIIPLQVPCLPLKRHAVHRQARHGHRRRRSPGSVNQLVIHSVLRERPGRTERRHDGRQRDEEQMKGAKRHPTSPLSPPRVPPPPCRGSLSQSCQTP